MFKPSTLIRQQKTCCIISNIFQLRLSHQQSDKIQGEVYVGVQSHWRALHTHTHTHIHTRHRGELHSSGLLRIEVVPKCRYGITTTRCVITQKSAVLIYFAAESWNHARYRGIEYSFCASLNSVHHYLTYIYYIVFFHTYFCNYFTGMSSGFCNIHNCIHFFMFPLWRYGKLMYL